MSSDDDTESLFIGVYGTWLWEAPEGFTAEDLEDLESFPPSDAWDLLTMLPGDGSDPTDEKLERLAERADFGDVKPRDRDRLLVLAVGRGRDMTVSPFTHPAVERGGGS